MSDEAEPRGQTAQAAQAESASAGKRWGDPISEERERQLRGILQQWTAETDHGTRQGPFQGRRVTGADVFWLTEQVRDRYGLLSDLHLEGADLHAAHLEGAHLALAHLEGAILTWAHLEGADLGGAHIERAMLRGAQLEGANLREAQLEGADLSAAHLERTDLSAAWLGSKTTLRNATLDNKTRLGDIQWGGVGAVNLTQIDWSHVTRLGDERGVGRRADASEHEAVVRAYRQVAAQLRAQGMAEVADRFAYRAQVRQRGVLLRRFQFPQYIFSWFLAILAGYGYRPVLTVLWYLAVIAGFTYMYMQATHGWVPFALPTPSSLAPLAWYEALILSVSAFHGRGFFQPLQSLGDPVAALAAIEAVIGLLIEISFIATFTQRYFGAR